MLFFAYLDKTYIITGSKIFNFLSKNYSNEIVQKWSWVSYVVTPAIIRIKFYLLPSVSALSNSQINLDQTALNLLNLLYSCWVLMKKS